MAVEVVKDRYGGERLKMVELNSEILGEITDGIDSLKAKYCLYFG
jgi:hypothetical protein